MGYQNTPSAPGLAPLSNVRTHCVPQFKKFSHPSSKLFPHGFLLSIYSVELFNLQVGCLELLLVRRNQHLGFREPHLCLRISGIRHKNPIITESGINIGIIQQFTVLMCMLLYFFFKITDGHNLKTTCYYLYDKNCFLLLYITTCHLSCHIQQI